MNGTEGTTLFLKLVAFVKLPVLYILFKSLNHPQWNSQMRQLNSRFQTPLNYTFCLNYLIIQLWILKAHQGYLVPWSFLTGTTSLLFSLSLISCGSVKERGKWTASVRDSSVREKFPMFSKKGISALVALVPIPCSILSHLISFSLMPMCLVG